MAGNKEKIIIELEVGTKQAISDVENLNTKLNEVLKTSENISKKGAGGISGGDVDKLLSNIQKMLQDAGGVRSRIENDKKDYSARVNTNKPESVEKYKEIEDSVGAFAKEFEKALAIVSTEVENLTRTSEELRRRKTPRSRVPGGPSWGEIPYPEDVDLNTRQAQRDKQKVTSRVTSSVSGLQRAADSGQLSYKQAEILEGQIRDVYLGSTGAKPKDYDDVVAFASGETKGETKWDVDDKSPLGRAQDGIKKTSTELHTLQDSLAGIREELYGKDARELPEEQENQLLLAEQKTLEEIKKQQKLREEHKSLLTEIVDGINRLEKARVDYEKQTGTTDIRKSAEEGSIKHAIASRANAIALSVGTAMAFSIKSAISEGKSIVEEQREDSLRIGFNTENNDFRGIRQEARTSGTHMGYTGTDMLGFSQSVMGSMGYSSETAGVTDALARAEKFTGAQEGAVTSLFESVLRTGGVTGAEEARDLSDMITGSIDASKMSGRADEHVSVLGAILDEQAAGRAMTNEEMKQQMAIINTLSGTGNKALQGENLAQNLGTLQANISASDPYSYFGFHAGVGTDPYFTGEGGLFRYREEMEKGLSSEYVLGGIQGIVDSSTSRDSALDRIVETDIFSGMSTDAIGEMVDLALADNLTLATGEELQEQIDAGKYDMDARQEGYDESSDSTHQEVAALEEARKANTSDNEFADAVAEFRRVVESFGAESPGKAFGVTAAIGGLTGLATGALGGLSLMGSPLLKNFGTTVQSVFGLGGVEGAASTAASTGLGSTISGGLSAAGTAGTNFLAGTAMNMGAGNLAGGAAMSTAGLATLGASTIAGGISAAAGTFSGVKDLFQTRDLEGKEKQDKMFSGGTKLGMVGTGAAAGAAIGSAIPVVGTAVGGVIGAGIGGAGALLGGEGLGGWLSDKWSGVGPTKVSAEGQQDAAEEQQSIAEAQQDVSTATSRASTESQRAENVHQETKNLSEWDRLVEEIRNVLDIARRQNGIIGSASGLNGAFASGGVGAGGVLGSVEKGAYWTNSNLQKHDVTKTSSELTSEQLDAWIADKAPANSGLIGMGSAFMKAGNQHGIDPRALVGIAAHESAWGTSKQAREKQNFFGMNANTNSPSDAFSYDNAEASIMNAADTLRRLYIEEGRTSLDEIGPKYAADTGWSRKVASHMEGAENYTAPSSGEININTTVNVSSSGSTKKDGDAIAKATQKSVEQSIAKYQVPIPSFYTQEMKRR